VSVATIGIVPPARYGLRGPRSAVATLAILGGVTGAAWWSTTASAVSRTTYGLAQVGRAMPFRSSLVAFFGMWITMMVAMMPPSAAPGVVGQGIRARPARSAASARSPLPAPISPPGP
jgi:hypothetical protein